MPHTPPALPSDADLRSQVRFSTEDGLIWLSGQRMLLLHLASLHALRREMMNTMGPITRGACCCVPAMPQVSAMRCWHARYGPRPACSRCLP